jgi:hypothetical protein
VAKEEAIRIYREAQQLEAIASTQPDDPLGLRSNQIAWSKVSVHYQQVVNHLDTCYSDCKKERTELPELMKEVCAWSLINACHARLLHMRVEDPEMLHYDEPSRVNREVNKLEWEIKSYAIGRRWIWNALQSVYDQWAEERRTAGLKNEADELQYHMLKARMKYRMWCLFAPFLNHWEGLIRTIIRSSGRLDRMIPGPLKAVWKWIVDLENALRASLEWSLYLVGKGLVWPFVVFVLLPILVCALVYDRNGWVCQLDGNQAGPVLPPESLRFAYSLYFSIFVFTGSEPGAVTACLGHPVMALWMAGEAIFAYVFMVVVIGYLVNRLSSR